MHDKKCVYFHPIQMINNCLFLSKIPDHSSWMISKDVEKHSDSLFLINFSYQLELFSSNWERQPFK